MLEKILEELKKLESLQFSRYTKPLISLEDAINIVNSHILDDDWIPVEQEIPEEKENPVTMDFYEYEVTFQSENVCDIRHYKFGRGHWWHGGAIVDEYVVAWRNLPEPYKRKENLNEV